MRILWQTGLHIAFYGGIVLALGATLSVWSIAIGGLLVWISVSDTQSFEIPDTANLSLIVLGLAWLVIVISDRATVIEHIVTALIWALAFQLIAFAYKIQRGREGLGFGDVKLIFGIGILCGIQGTVLVVLFASVTATLMILLSRTRIFANETQLQSPLMSMGIAFGPFLCAATWGVWLSLFSL